MSCEENVCCENKEACTVVNNYYGCCKSEEEVGNGIGIPVLTEPITKTIEITDLQTEIDALPKILMVDVTFNVNAGTYDGGILIAKFMGSGVLTIIGANAVGQATHNVSNITIRYCSNSRVVVQGFNATEATVSASFTAYNCSAYVYFNYCNATAGTNIITGSYGILAENSSLIHVGNCTFKNQSTVIRAKKARVFIYNLAGSNNSIVFNADNSGIIQKENPNSISGTTVNSYGGGGLIINHSGGTIGS